MNTSRWTPGRLTTWSCCLGMLAVGINGTAIMAALPTMRTELGLDTSTVTWAVNAYLLASASCIILGGSASDRYGSRRVALVGLFLFGAASAMIALAIGPGSLLVGRTVQGLGAALAVPATLAATGQSAGPDGRAAALSAWAGALMLGFSLGPLIGGAITHMIGWRPVFWCTAAALLVSALGLRAASPSSPVPNARTARSFDAAGFLLLAGSMLAASLALQGVGSAFRRPLGFWLPLVAAGALFTLFIRIERRRSEPFVDLAAAAASTTFVRSVLIGAVAMFCILPTLLFFNIYAQGAKGLRLTPVEAGLMLVPMSAGLFVLARLAPRLVRSCTHAKAIGAALGAVVVAAVLIGAAAVSGGKDLLMAGLLLLGAGLAVPYATAPRLALGALPAGAEGQSSGLINACTFLGGSLGVSFGALVYPLGGLPAVMTLVAAAALLGIIAAKGLTGQDTHEP